MRTNSEAQSMRTKSGKRCEEDCVARLHEILEKHGLDSDYEIRQISSRKKKYEFDHIVYRPKPDFVLYRKSDNTPVLPIGVKRSLRERWREDDCHAGVMKEAYPGMSYILFTHDKTKTIQKRTPEMWRLDAIFNIETTDAMETFIVRVLTADKVVQLEVSVHALGAAAAVPA